MRSDISILMTRDELMTLLNAKARWGNQLSEAEQVQLTALLNRAAAIHGYPDHVAAWDDELGERTLRDQAEAEAEADADADLAQARHDDDQADADTERKADADPVHAVTPSVTGSDPVEGA